jgi:hypothetical protein
MSVPAAAIADAYDRLVEQAVALLDVRGARRHAKAPAALPVRRMVQAMGVDASVLAGVEDEEIEFCDFEAEEAPQSEHQSEEREEAPTA